MNKLGMGAVCCWIFLITQIVPGATWAQVMHPEARIIFDITGNVVMHQADRAEADVGGLPPGIYLYRATTGESVRFIIAGH